MLYCDRSILPMSLRADTWLYLSTNLNASINLLVQRSSKILSVNLVVRILFHAIVKNGLNETVIEVIVGSIMTHQQTSYRGAALLTLFDQQASFK